MKKTIKTLALFITVMLVLCACSVGPKVDRKKESAVKEYTDSFMPEAEKFFTELSETASGVSPKVSGLAFEYVSMEFLKAGKLPFDEVLKNRDPIIVAGLSKKDGSYTEEEIDAVLKEAQARGLTVDLYFDGEDFFLYRVRPDKIEIDVTKAADGGAYHEIRPYEGPKEEHSEAEQNAAASAEKAGENSESTASSETPGAEPSIAAESGGGSEGKISSEISEGAPVAAGGRIVENGYIKVSIPESWEDSWTYANHIDDDGTYWTEFHEEPDYSAGQGGWLLSIVQVYDNDVDKYKGNPHFDYIGEINAGGGLKYGLIAVYPTDVQPSIEQMDNYFKMYDDIGFITDSIETVKGAVLRRGEGGLSEYMLPASDIYYFTEYDLKDLTPWELKIGRNEIYAKHGRRFSDADIQAYFDSKSWYSGTIDPSHFSEDMLSDVEKANVEFIKQYESKL